MLFQTKRITQYNYYDTLYNEKKTLWMACVLYSNFKFYLLETSNGALLFLKKVKCALTASTPIVFKNK